MASVFFFGLGISIILVFLSTFSQFFKTNKSTTTSKKLPPGSTGWPIIGQSFAYMTWPEKFIRGCMKKYSPHVFQTSLAGQKMAIFCGPSGNKFIFSNEGKLVDYWLPYSAAIALSHPKPNTNSTPSGRPLEPQYKFLRLESIQKFVPTVDSMMNEHFNTFWVNNDMVKVHALAKDFTFALSCRLLVNYSRFSLEQARELAKPFYLSIEGILSVPLDVPGTPFNKARKGGKLANEMVVEMIKERRKERLCGERVDGDSEDLLGRFLDDAEENGSYWSDEEIACKIIGLMFAGFYPTTTALTFLVGHLADHPDVYDKVFQEQSEIAREKQPGEALTWTDLQKMTYSWNVICESMRLKPPVPGNFREAKTDFSYAGFKIPKGWKIHWTVHTTHRNPEYFPEPEKFDPSRFEGKGPAPYTFVPFGAGSRMCAGKYLARIQTLVFLHHAVKRFKFKRVNPEEKIIFNPDPVPTEGFLVYLQPHET